jgi:hypothetical protein
MKSDFFSYPTITLPNPSPIKGGATDGLLSPQWDEERVIFRKIKKASTFDAFSFFPLNLGRLATNPRFATSIRFLTSRSTPCLRCNLLRLLGLSFRLS